MVITSRFIFFKQAYKRYEIIKQNMIIEENVQFKPKIITWMYSGKCNMNCKFCYGVFNNDLLTMEQKYSIVDKIADSSVKKLTITGGEPLLGEGIFKIIDYCKEKNIFVSLHTNGLLLDDNALNKLDGKVGRISLSLDGSNNLINKEMRGIDGYFDLVKNLIKKISAKKIPLSLKTVASKKNIEDIPNIAKKIKNMDLDLWLISQFNPKNRGKENRDEFEISDKVFLSLEEKIIKLPFERYFRNLDTVETIPYFFVDSNGYVSSNNGNIIDSLLCNNIPNIWKKIIKTAKIKEVYYEKTARTKI